ncbi:MAG: NUDIX domain-containing protein [candidate division WOR-3 bacterium]|nr:NUDIX domain-containing protein [candidate division WOR-3 bacterium]
MADSRKTSEGLPFGLAVKAIIKDGKDRCLVLRRSRANRTGRAVWELPGGKVAPGESFADALVRRVKAECGLDVTPTRAVAVLQTEMPELHVVRLLMEVKVLSGAVELSTEHDCYQWIPIADLDLPCPGCRQLEKKARGREESWSIVWRSWVP